MPVRYEPIGEMSQDATGRYVTHEDFADLGKELLEAGTDYIAKVGRAELSPQEADAALRVLVRMLTA